MDVTETSIALVKQSEEKDVKEIEEEIEEDETQLKTKTKKCLKQPVKKDKEVIKTPKSDLKLNKKVKEKEDQEELQEEEIQVKTKTKKRLKKPVEKEKDIIKTKVKEEEDNIEIIEETVQTELNKRINEKEGEVEIIVEEVQQKKKKIKAKKPIEAEEVVPEETVDILDITPTQHVKGLTLKTPAQISEAIPEAVASLIGEVPTTGVTGNLTILTFSAIEQQEIQGAEKEDDRPASLMPTSFKAKPEVDSIEPYFITQPQVESVANEFSNTFKPTTREAIRTVTPREGIVISEVIPDQRVEHTKQTKTDESHATVSMLLHEAKSVSEIEASDKERDFEISKQPVGFTATPGINLQESLNITEVTESIKEDKVEDFNIQNKVKPNVDIPENESLIISEVLAETKPGKYFPELFVPTEIATPSIVSQRNTASTEEMNLPEKEGEYIPHRLPQKQFAGLQILQEDSIVVSETNVHEMETTFGPGQKPFETNASQEINVLEGVVVSMVQHEVTESKLDIPQPEFKTVDVQFTKKESFVTQETNVAESGEVLQSHEVPYAKTALTTISCLEIPGVSETMSAELLDEYKPAKTPSQALAVLSIEPNEPISVVEVKAEHTPIQLSDVLKYRTDAATPKFVTLKSTEITQVVTQDKEEPLSAFGIPTPVSGKKTYEIKEGISIYHTETIEKEGDYTANQIPETHTGKTVPTHSLQSVTIEEITSEGNVANIIETHPTSANAKLEHTTFQETLVEEAVINESVVKHPEDKVPQKMRADLTILEEQCVSVTEVITDQKEDQYIRPKLPEECFASQSHMPQKVATKTETVPEQTTAPFSEKSPTLGVAKADQESLEGLVISSVEIAESESELVKPSPTEIKANVELSEQFTGVTIQEIVSNEKEVEHVPKEVHSKLKASCSITPHHTAVQSAETLAEINLGNISVTEQPTGSAKVQTTLLQEVIVTETNATETESLLDTIKPDLKLATIGIRHGESFLVSEVVADDKEGVFKTTQLPETQIATFKLKGQEVVEHQENIELIQEGSWTRRSPVKDQATITQDTIQLAVASQQVPSEMEGTFEAPIKQTEKVAALSFVEGNVLSVTETSLVDKEVPFETATAPKTAFAMPDISGQDVAVVSEVVVDMSIGDVDVLKFDFSEAKIKQNTLESVTLQETTVGEREGEYVADVLPEMKRAKPNIAEGHSTSVSSIVTLQDKENIFITPNKPKERIATQNINSQEIAEKTEIVLGSSLDTFTQKIPTIAQATTAQLPHHSIIQTETSSNELEGIIQLQSKPENKTADVSFEDAQAVTIYEISAEHSTSKIAPEIKPEDQFATRDILPRQVAQSTVIVPENTTGDVITKVPSKALATVEQIPHESISTSVTSTAEKESSFDYKMKLDLKQAENAVEEEISVIVSEVTVEVKEEDLKTFSRPKEVTAFADIASQEIAQTTETSTEYSIGVVPEFQKPYVKALKEQVPHESLVQTETSIQEKEGIFCPLETPSSSVAEIGFVEGKGVVITEVVSEHKEDKFIMDYAPEKTKAEQQFIPIELYEKAEIVPGNTVSELEEIAPALTHAKAIQTTLHSVVLKQTTVGESEAPLESFIKPFSKQADTSYEAAKTGINVDEITIHEKECTLEGPVKPIETTAETMLPAREIASKSEVLVESTAEEFETQGPTSVTATVDQTPLHSVILSEISTAEKEGYYEGLIKPDSKSAGISFEEGQGVSIVEVITGDMETSFLPGDTPYGKTVNVSVIGREIAVKTEIITESSLSDMPKEEQHPTKIVNVQQDTLESVITTKPIVNEKENNIDEFVKSETQIANVTFEEGKSLTVSSIVLEDKESPLKLPQFPKERTAGTHMTTHGIAAQSIVQTEHSISELSEPHNQLVEATPGQIPLESIVMSVPEVIEKEGTFDNRFVPDRKTALSVLDERQSVSVVLTTPSEKEAHFDDYEKPKKRIAAPVISDLEISEKFEPNVQLSLGDLEPIKHIMTKANTQHTTFESVVQTVTEIRENEGQFQVTSNPDKKRASISYEAGQTINILEVTLGEAETEFSDKPWPSDRVKASVVLTDTQEVAKQTQITPEDSLGAFSQVTVIEEKAVEQQTALSTSSVSENFLQEKETEFSGHFKPNTKRANFTIEEGRKVQTVTEVVPEHKEGVVARLEMPDDKRAVTEIITRDVVEVAETLTQISLGEVVSKKTIHTSAIRTQTPYETSVNEQVIIQESEDQFIQTVPKTRKASMVFEEGEGLIITEVTTEDSEAPYSRELPVVHVAHPEILLKEAAETIEVSSELQPSQMTVVFPDKVKAHIDQSHFPSVLQTEVKIEESEIEFKSEHAGKKTAEVFFEEKKGISVFVVTVEDKEAPLNIVETSTFKNAVPMVFSHDSLLSSEVQPEQTVGELRTETPKEVQAIKEHPVNESVVVTHHTTEEKEEIMSGEFKTDYVKAQVEVSKMGKVAETSEVITGIVPESLETFKPNEIFAAPDAVLLEGLIQSEVNLSEVENKLIKHGKPDKRKASIVEDVHESITVTQTVVAEKEEIQETKPFPEGVRPLAKISEQEPVIHTEVMASSSTSDLVENEKLIKRKASIIKEVAESIKVSQTVVAEKEGIFEAQPLPEGVKSSTNISQQETVVQTEVLISSSTSDLVEPEKPVTRKASVIKDIQESIKVSQIVVAEKEGIHETKPLPEEIKPSAKISEQEPVVHTEVLVSSSTSELNQDEKPLKRKASIIEEIQQSIEVCQTVVAEKEGTHEAQLLPQGVKPSTKISEQETVVQTEVLISSSTSDLVEPEKPVKRKASIIKEVQESIKVSHTVVAEKEGIHEAQPLPEGVKPSTNISVQETIVHTEVLISSSTSDLVKDKLPEQQKVHPKQIPFESLETTVTTAHEQEERMDALWKPAVSKAVKSVEETQSIEVTEVVPGEIELEDMEKEKTPKVVAEKTYIDQEVAVQSEVIPQIPVVPMDISTPTLSIAKQSTPIQHHLTVTSHDTGEIEESLPRTVKPFAQTTTIGVEENKPSLIVSQVHPQEVPGKSSNLILICVHTKSSLSKTITCLSIYDRLIK